MKRVQNAAAFIFIAAVAVFSAVAVFGVWEVFDEDVIGKSFQTLGLLALVAVIVMAAGRFIESRSASPEAGVPDLPHPAFRSIRRTTLWILIVAVSLLAFLGVLAIWEVIQDKDILYKSLGSLGILAFGAFIMVMTCLERENKLGRSGGGRHSLVSSIGTLVLLLILGYTLFSISRLFFWR